MANIVFCYLQEMKVLYVSCEQVRKILDGVKGETSLILTKMPFDVTILFSILSYDKTMGNVKKRCEVFHNSGDLDDVKEKITKLTKHCNKNKKQEMKQVRDEMLEEIDKLLVAAEKSTGSLGAKLQEYLDNERKDE